MAIESPKYSVISKNPSYEVRLYEPYVVAQVEIESGFDDAVNLGFSPLAGYIFGDNKSRSHIAMTVPVTEEPAAAPQKIPMTRPVTAASSGPGRYRVSFTMPKKYSIETLPEPNNTSISFKALPAHKAAAIRFTGRMNARLFERKEKELRSSLESDGITVKSGAVAAQYDPPWIPGFLRRNEILLDI
jgi:hypothetical protein